MLASMTEIRMQASMEHIIRRLEAIHRALRTAPASLEGDSRVTEAVARCLRQLHAIAAQSADRSGDGSAPSSDQRAGAPPALISQREAAASFVQAFFGNMAEAA